MRLGQAGEEASRLAQGRLGSRIVFPPPQQTGRCPARPFPNPGTGSPAAGRIASALRQPSLVGHLFRTRKGGPVLSKLCHLLGKIRQRKGTVFRQLAQALGILSGRRRIPLCLVNLGEQLAGRLLGVRTVRGVRGGKRGFRTNGRVRRPGGPGRDECGGRRSRAATPRGNAARPRRDAPCANSAPPDRAARCRADWGPPPRPVAAWGSFRDHSVPYAWAWRYGQRRSRGSSRSAQAKQARASGKNLNAARTTPSRPQAAAERGDWSTAQRGPAGLPSRQGVRDWPARRSAVPGSPHATSNSNSRQSPRRGLLPPGESRKPSAACRGPLPLPATTLFLMPSSVSSAGGCYGLPLIPSVGDGTGQRVAAWEGNSGTSRKRFSSAIRNRFSHSAMKPIISSSRCSKWW